MGWAKGGHATPLFGPGRSRGCRYFLRMLGHSISILLNTYAHFIPTMQGEADQLMRDLFTPVQIELKDLEK